MRACRMEQLHSRAHRSVNVEPNGFGAPTSAIGGGAAARARGACCADGCVWICLSANRTLLTSEGSSSERRSTSACKGLSPACAIADGRSDQLCRRGGLARAQPSSFTPCRQQAGCVRCIMLPMEESRRAQQPASGGAASQWPRSARSLSAQLQHLPPAAVSGCLGSCRPWRARSPSCVPDVARFPLPSFHAIHTSNANTALIIPKTVQQKCIWVRRL